MICERDKHGTTVFSPQYPQELPQPRNKAERWCWQLPHLSGVCRGRAVTHQLGAAKIPAEDNTTKCSPCVRVKWPLLKFLK